MRHLAAVSSLLLAAACGNDAPLARSHAPRAEQGQPSFHAQVDLSPTWQEGDKTWVALNLTLSADGADVPVPFHVVGKGPSVVATKQTWNCSDEGSGPEGFKLLVKEGWQTLRAGHKNEVKLGGIFAVQGDLKSLAFSVNGADATHALADGPKAQDPPSKAQTDTKTTPVTTSAPAPAADGDETALKETVKGFIRKLCDEPRTVPADVTHGEETRGGPGAFEKLTAAQVDELVAGIIYTAKTFTPSHLKIEERCALIAVDISAESAFQIGTAGLNPNPSYGDSVNVMQVTPSIYVPMFQKRAQIDGLHHYDGSPWNPADTTERMMIDSIFDSMVVSAWGMSEQGKSGAGNPRATEFGEDVGNAPKTWETSLLCWVVGYPAVRKGPGDPAYNAQAFHYINMQSADLALLGFPASLLTAEF